MISKNTIKRLNQLAQKKFRNKEQLFLVEGDKMIMELADSEFEIAELFFTAEVEPVLRKSRIKAANLHLVTPDELKKISLLKTPQNSLAVCRMPKQIEWPKYLEDTLTIYLDSIQDPGNLGTILRICDWFGISKLFCSPETVDAYSPKVIQASMGSFARVNVFECAFTEIRALANKSEALLYGAFMDGENVYSQRLANKAILIMGNEGNGISNEIEKQIDHKLSIPNFSQQKQKAESLNVSVATAILCSEFRRNA